MNLKKTLKTSLISYLYTAEYLLSTNHHVLLNKVQLFFINSNISTGIIKNDTSDHFPIFVISNRPDVGIHTTIFRRYINNNSFNNFKTILSEADRESLLNINCPNMALSYNNFYQYTMKPFLRL